MQTRILKIAICANPTLGSASFAWRVKTILESAGHTVFFFSPAIQPQLFEQAGEGAPCTDDAPESAPNINDHKQTSSSVLALKHADLHNFFKKQQLHVLLTADNVIVDDNFMSESSGKGSIPAMPVGALVDSFTSADALHAVEKSHLYTFSICSAGAKKPAGIPTASVPLEADFTYTQTPIVNTIAAEAGVIVTEDASPESLESLKKILAKCQLNHKVTCFGNNWPEEFSATSAYIPGGDYLCGHRQAQCGNTNAFAYTSRSSYAHLELSESSQQNFLSAYCEADGVPTVRVFDKSITGAHAIITDNMNDPEDVNLASVAAQLDANKTQAQNKQTRKFSKRAFAKESPFDQVILNAIERVAPARASWGAYASANAAENQPRTIVTIMGYFGMGNFGDEYILTTIERLIRQRYANATVCAISDNPAHTLKERGIYALAPSNHAAINQALAQSSAAVIPAGLLFDQGIRWTAGKTALFETFMHSDIPGLTAFAMLAHMNSTPVVFHGIGAGPLEEPDSVALVQLLSRTRCVFTPRDVETGNLLRACGVNPIQVADKADTAFLGSYEETTFTKQWIAENIVEGQQIFTISLRNYDENPHDFAQILAGTLDRICSVYENVVPTFCILDQDDLTISQSVISNMQHAVRTRIFNPENNLDAQVDLLRFAHAGFSMRYHCSLLLNSFGVPCVGINYLPKVGSLYAQMGAQDLLLPVDATNDDYFAVINNMLSNHDTISKRTQRAVKSLRQSAQEALEILYAEIQKPQHKKAALVAESFAVGGAYPTCVPPEPPIQNNSECPAEPADAQAADDNNAEAAHEAAEMQQLAAENASLRRRVAELERQAGLEGVAGVAGAGEDNSGNANKSAEATGAKNNQAAKRRQSWLKRKFGK